MSISSRLWSADNPKAIKAQKFGALNAIMYLAPASIAGVGNMCPHASPGCEAACLAFYSGQASMVLNSDDASSRNNVRESRILKTQAFMRDRKTFLRAMALQLSTQYWRACAARVALIARPNGGTDIAFEGLAIDVDAALAARLTRLSGVDIAPGKYASIFTLFPFVIFNDYTKNIRRMRRYMAGNLPPNYHLTFSRSEANEAEVSEVIAKGGNVAVVFDKRPATWRGVPVIDGDQHDLRCRDPRGVIVGLTPKGRKAKRDTSGFMVRTI